jgi:hypothetical protein
MTCKGAHALFSFWPSRQPPNEILLPQLPAAVAAGEHQCPDRPGFVQGVRSNRSGLDVGGGGCRSWGFAASTAGCMVSRNGARSCLRRHHAQPKGVYSRAVHGHVGGHHHGSGLRDSVCRWKVQLGALADRPALPPRRPVYRVSHPAIHWREGGGQHADGMGVVFVGIGRFGRRRSFNLAGTESIEFGGRNLGGAILLRPQFFILGGTLTKPRRDFIFEVLKLLKARLDRKQPAPPTAP